MDLEVVPGMDHAWVGVGSRRALGSVTALQPMPPPLAPIVGR
jgi:hypothetical protein